LTANSEEIAEAQRLRTEFPYFAQHFLRIKTKKGELIPFTLNRSQLHLWSVLDDCEKNCIPARIIILKARQLGMSTFVQGFLLWKAIMDPNKNGLVVSHMKDAASRLFEKIEVMYDLLPKELKGELEKIRDSKKKGLKIGWGGDLQTSINVDTAGNRQLGRGDTLHWVHLSEPAFYAGAEDIIFGLNAAVPKDAGTAIILESTANGMGNYFYRTWKRSAEGKSNYIPVFLPWHWDEGNRRKRTKSDYPITPDERQLMSEHDLDEDQVMWRRDAIIDECDGDEEKFRQENPASADEAFLISGRPFFDRLVLKQMLDECRSPLKEGDFDIDSEGRPFFEEFKDGPWRIYNRPVEGRSYAIGADVSSGSDRDSSAAHVLDVDTMEVVATFRGKLDEDQFALSLKWIGLADGHALLAVERNNSGRACVLALQRMGYDRMFFHQHEDEWSGGVKQVWGWHTNVKTRPPMLAQLREAVRRGSLILYDERTVHEMGSFVFRGDKPAAARGAHDDMVMSLGIVCSEEVRNQAMGHAQAYEYHEPETIVSDITGY
jgi:hypothetical protein